MALLGDQDSVLVGVLQKKCMFGGTSLLGNRLLHGVPHSDRVSDNDNTCRNTTMDKQCQYVIKVFL
jgi:hypothetical protein